ncbi:nuclear transport factor 2 family protein [Singulisphaera sp. Ch08]|uniref:Nuclear transport factor 2 family protein n=1 Tax=Singulisphaera sp. Ch08 TaxID=3120278 RepID=A0AAU7CGK5_9BACT
MPINLGSQSGARRWGTPMVIFTSVVIGVVAVSRATYPQDGEKAQVATPASPGEAEIRNLLKAVYDAYNQADAKGLAARFTDDAVLIGQDGGEVRGGAAIGRHYADAFGNGPTCKISGVDDTIHFLTPGIASVVGHFQLEDGVGGALASGRFGLIAVRKGDQWQLAELRDDSTEPRESSDSEEPLRDLEWLVGEWVDEGEDGKVATQVRWDENQKFLVRKYSAQFNGEPATSGTQWIGWDPQAKQIRSWNFDSGGGFGQGEWTRSGDAWIIKAGGVTGDGLTTSATQVIESVNKDVVKFQSNDRIVGADLLPDIDEVLMVRKPPAPDTSQPAPPPEQKTPAGAPAPESERTPSRDRS